MTAHKYDNFADAFADLCTTSIYVRTLIANAKTNADWALYYVGESDWANAITQAASGVWYLADAFENFLDKTDTEVEESHFFETIYWGNADAGGDPLTMRAILDEMFTADNEELMQFIALVDAYRQSLWNKPFDVDYWAAVARGFEQWEF